MTAGYHLDLLFGVVRLRNTVVCQKVLGCTVHPIIIYITPDAMQSIGNYWGSAKPNIGLSNTWFQALKGYLYLYLNFFNILILFVYIDLSHPNSGVLLF